MDQRKVTGIRLSVNRGRGCVISSEVENCAVLGYYAAINSNSTMMFRDNVYVPKRL